MRKNVTFQENIHENVFPKSCTCLHKGNKFNFSRVVMSLVKLRSCTENINLIYLIHILFTANFTF